MLYECAARRPPEAASNNRKKQFVEIKDVIEILKAVSLLATPQQKTENLLIGKRVLVRTYSAGVHTGTLVSRDGMECTLKDGYRIWNWTGGGLSLSSIATAGMKGGKTDKTAEVMLTNCVEFLPVTDEAWDTYGKFQA